MEARWPTLLGDGAVNKVGIEAIHHLIKVTHEFRVRRKTDCPNNDILAHLKSLKKSSRK